MRGAKHVKASADATPSDTSLSPPPRAEASQWVVFRLDSERYALPLAAVDRIVRAAHFTALPLAPAVVLGAIDVGGEIFPVFNLRHRFGLPERLLDPNDHLLIARAAQRTVVLVIDAALEVIERAAAAVIDSDSLVPDLAHVRGIMALPDGLVLIQDLEQLLSQDEASALDQAMGHEGAAHAG
jgi:purine-binding chemotaxis protein CheW